MWHHKSINSQNVKTYVVYMLEPDGPNSERGNDHLKGLSCLSYHTIVAAQLTLAVIL